MAAYDRNYTKFFISALEEDRSQNTIEEILGWVEDFNQSINLSLTKVPLSELQGWIITDNAIKHISGKFFSIIGLKNSDENELQLWNQPIINQPEIGILGFLTKEINGILHFLIQAKIEPGNINKVQLSPTLQATRSNYMKVHKGRSPDYLQYFTRAKHEHILIDQVQSEQGSRFLYKRNRNMIVYTEGNVEVLPNYRWVTLNQIKRLMSIDNLVNMDTKTILSNIPFNYYDPNIDRISSAFSNSLIPTINKDWERSILSQFANHRSNPSYQVEKIPLDSLDEWLVTPELIMHKENKYFQVQGVRIKIENREVKYWDQPMIAPTSRGTCILFAQEQNNTLKFLFQFKKEIGIFDHIQLGPSIQTHLNKESNEFTKLEYSELIFDKSNINSVLFDTIQSEEGGRFYREENQYSMFLLNKEAQIKLRKNFIWLTLYEINELIKYGYFVNIQARNLISQIDFSKKWEHL